MNRRNHLQGSQFAEHAAAGWPGEFRSGRRRPGRRLAGLAAVLILLAAPLASLSAARDAQIPETAARTAPEQIAEKVAEKANEPEKSEGSKKPATSPKPEAENPAATTQAKIQIAILLDTSGSMESLINQARTHLWKMVNEFAKATREGTRPELTVAVFEYGKSSLKAEDGYLRMIVPLTDDLDKISEELFALSTNGGEEYCGMAIEAALKQLQWSDSNDDVKCIFVAGNEPFTQGSVDPYKACEAAIARGITVSTIFCGPEQEGVATGWQRGAQSADGSYIAIDHNQVAAQPPAPQDKELARLSSELNRTYVFYGDAAARSNRESLQKRQDALAAAAAPQAAADRAIAKGSSAYRNSQVDLVDAVAEKKLKLAEVQEESLPDELRGKSPEEKEAYIRQKAERRAELQGEIKKLAAERERYLAEQTSPQTGEGRDSLDSALIKVVRQQGEKRNFRFEAPSE